MYVARVVHQRRRDKYIINEITYPQSSKIGIQLEGKCPIYVICACLCIVVSNTYCFMFLFCLYSSCLPYFVSFSGLSIFDCALGIV